MAVLVTGGLFFELPLPLIAVHDGEARVQDGPCIESRKWAARCSGAT